LSVTVPAAAYSISSITGDRNRHIDSDDLREWNRDPGLLNWLATL
jgi:hypothetical protein